MQHSFEALDRPGGYARVGLLRPLRHRDFRVLWAGMAVSLTGDGVFLIAATWAAFELPELAGKAIAVLGIASDRAADDRLFRSQAERFRIGSTAAGC